MRVNGLFRSVCAGLAVVLSAAFAGAQEDGAPPVVSELRAELTKPFAETNRPLPVVSHWDDGFGTNNFSSDYQVELLAQGHHVMPTLHMPAGGTLHYPPAGRALVRRLATWGAPMTLADGQWDSVLYSDRDPVEDPGRWLKLPPAESPLALSPDGAVTPWLSPLGAVAPWKEAGEYAGRSGAMAELATWYPNPPLVILLSNNEPQRLMPTHHLAEKDSRFVAQYGSGASEETQRQVMADGYVERYRALLKGLSEGLPSDFWRSHVRCVGYDAFGPPHFGRWFGWKEYSLLTPERLDPWHLAWDGASVSYYTHNWNASTDYCVWSPQVEAMNWVMMLEEARKDKPDFWFELSIWDGNWGSAPVYAKEKSKVSDYQRAGQTWSPERYAGFVQYGMWLLTPRVVREFRGSAVLRSDFQPDFEALVAAVDRVWTDPILTRFWRSGALVPNRDRRHPYQCLIPARYRAADRWFMLNTSLDPAGEWQLDTVVPVFSLARVIGEPGRREWLVYAHSPLERRPGVVLTLPGFGQLRVDVPPAGCFYYVREQDRSVRRLGAP